MLLLRASNMKSLMIFNSSTVIVKIYCREFTQIVNDGLTDGENSLPSPDVFL